jgi:hypothetical protein
MPYKSAQSSNPYADVHGMTETPTLSPWPAPTLADAALQRAEPKQVVVEPPLRRSVSALLDTARRLSSRSERAEHAAMKEEQRIRDELTDLPAGWYVLPSLDAAELDVDDQADARRLEHVVIGPGGVFIINLEHQSGAKVWVSEHTVTIDGRETDRLRDARFEARRASGQLTDSCGFNVTVQAVLVLIDAATVQTLSRPAEVHVRTQHDLRDWLCKQPSRLDPYQVRAIHDHVRAGATPN